MIDTPITPETEERLRGVRNAQSAGLDGYTIYRTEYEPPTFVFEGLLAHGLTILAGRPKCGKSWLTLQMAIAAAMGRPLFERFKSTAAQRVLYCGLEEAPPRTHNRLRKLVPRPEIQLQNIMFVYELPTLTAGGEEELDRHLTAERFGLAVIDTFLRFAGASGSSKDVMRGEYSEIARLHRLAHKHQLAMVLVDHTRKMGADNGLDTVAGTSGKTAACDAVWTLKKQPTGDGVLEITGREMEEQTLGLRLMAGEDFGWHLTGEGPEVGMTEARLEIVELLKDEAALAPARIAGLLRKNAVTIRRLLQKLAADDLVRKDSSGRYFLTSRVCNSVSA